MMRKKQEWVPISRRKRGKTIEEEEEEMAE
jgi:hypothetical protein